MQVNARLEDWNRNLTHVMMCGLGFWLNRYSSLSWLPYHVLEIWVPGCVNPAVVATLYSTLPRFVAMVNLSVEWFFRRIHTSRIEHCQCVQFVCCNKVRTHKIRRQRVTLSKNGNSRTVKRNKTHWGQRVVPKACWGTWYDYLTPPFALVPHVGFNDFLIYS